MTNRLSGERSPYLLQHSENPVDWFPWGEAAFLKAKAENKLIFLSIGYSACHWCHVMEHESFEDAATAALLNQYFVSIKVDREERPDIDQIYQLAHQVLQRRAGGWPLSMFLTPEQKPIVGGTYFPRERRFGMPAFQEVLQSVLSAWNERTADVLAQADELTDVLKEATQLPESGGDLSKHHLRVAVAQALRSADRVNGGFGKAPKFPSPPNVALWAMGAVFLRDPHATEQWLLTLDRMAAGGLYDHLGGGFARYSTDERWLIPHFEKMLYDNGQLLSLYVDGYKFLHSASSPDALVRRAHYKEVIEQTVAYLAREMVDPLTGAFYSAQDADSEGQEGKFFTWNPSEIAHAIDPTLPVKALCDYWGVTNEGNFEHGHSALWTPRTLQAVAQTHQLSEQELTAAVTNAREQLFVARATRPAPATDNKCIAAWNALTIVGLIEAGMALQRLDWITLAERALRAWYTYAWRAEPKALTHAIKHDHAYGAGFLDDVAGLGLAALCTFESLGDLQWFRFAHALGELLLEQFWDAQQECFFFTRADSEHVLHRAREFYDHAQPSGVALACELLLRLHTLTEQSHYRQIAETQLKRLVPMACERALGFGSTIKALDHAARGSVLVVLLGDAKHEGLQALLFAAMSVYLPHRVIVHAASIEQAIEGGISRSVLDGRQSPSDTPTCYVCHAGVCLAPITTTDALVKALVQLRSP
jgi:uncharacterized protein YyaL (SSP411 family)